MNQKYLEKLLSTSERAKVLRHILIEDEALKVEKTAKELNISKGMVSQFFRILLEYGILEKKGRKVFVDFQNYKTMELKRFLNISELDVSELKKIKEVAGIGVYGSWVSGTNTKESDLDIWIKAKKHPSEKRIAEIQGEIRMKKGYNIHILVLSAERIERLKKEDPVFFYSLAYGSVIIWGENIA